MALEKGDNHGTERDQYHRSGDKDWKGSVSEDSKKTENANGVDMEDV